MAQQLVEERTANGRTWAIYGAPRVNAGIEQMLQIAIAADETSTYAITAVSRAFLADAMREAVLAPAIDAFTPNSAATPEASAPATPAAEAAAAPAATAEESAAAAAEGEAPCPDRTFPLVEPDYTAKRPLDLSAFDAALAAFTPQRAAAMDALLAGKNMIEVQELLFDGTFTSVDLVTYYVDRIQRYDVGQLNAVLELNPQALADAAAADAARASNTGTGALFGIPVLLKDNIATAGMHTTAGAYALKDWMPERDAFLVQQLRADGAIILGKTNLSEWANYMDPCMPNGFSTLGGQTRNPYGPHETYGSSSGSGVATGANLATVAVGSETSGSLIQPARVNSVVGMRPSLGLVSRDYVVPLAPVVDTPGPMGRSVTDVALLLNALSGVDANDPTTADAAALADTDFTLYLSLEEARKVRVGVVEPNAFVAKFFPALQPALEASLGRPATPEELMEAASPLVLPSIGALPMEAIAGLTAQGIEYVVIDDATLPPDSDTAWSLVKDGFKFGIADFFAAVGDTAPIRSVADIVAINQEDLANRAPYGQRSIEASANSATTPEEYAASVAAAQAAADAWLSTVLEQNDVDILVYNAFYATNAGGAGVPALTVPAGLDPNGRPQGIILTGPHLSDPQLIAVGYALEQALNGRVEPDLDSTIPLIDATIAQ